MGRKGSFCSARLGSSHSHSVPLTLRAVYLEWVVLSYIREYLNGLIVHFDGMQRWEYNFIYIYILFPSLLFSSSRICPVRSCTMLDCASQFMEELLRAQVQQLK